jgi:hypothetical protein
VQLSRLVPDTSWEAQHVLTTDEGSAIAAAGSRRSGLRWLTALIQKLWDIAWDMWDNRNRVLHDTGNSVVREVESEQITASFNWVVAVY